MGIFILVDGVIDVSALENEYKQFWSNKKRKNKHIFFHTIPSWQIVNLGYGYTIYKSALKTREDVLFLYS